MRREEVNWIVKDPIESTVYKLMKDLPIPRPIALVLANRGINDPEEARIFLKLPLTILPSPFQLKGMERAVERVEIALKRKEKICIYGDYDADGITATALLSEYLASRGAKVQYKIPIRTKWGYGLKKEIIKEISNWGVSLIITVDCGISDIQEIEAATQLDIDIIVTDHHEPPILLPKALALLNPKLGDYPFKDLAGVGVALKLAEALAIRDKEDEGRREVMRKFLDLVAIGTIGDMALLLGENRFYARFGLKLLNKGRRPGCVALRDVSGCLERQITPWEVSFLLAPRMNAAGRMGDASRAVELLLTREEDKAMDIAKELQHENLRRQKIEEGIFTDALERLEREKPGPFILLGSREWHPGVIGIVASRLAERYHRPAALVAFSESGIGRGSARSYGDVDIYSILKRCLPWLKALGGHRGAAGFTLEEKRFHPFKESLWVETLHLIPSPLPPKPLEVEGEIQMCELNSSLLRGLKELEPFGEGHPEPIFLLKEIKPKQIRTVGNNHLKFMAIKEGVGIEAIAFGMGERRALHEGEPVDIAFFPELREWQGKRELQLKVKGIKKSKV